MSNSSVCPICDQSWLADKVKTRKKRLMIVNKRTNYEYSNEIPPTPALGQLKEHVKKHKMIVHKRTNYACYLKNTNTEAQTFYGITLPSKSIEFDGKILEPLSSEPHKYWGGPKGTKRTLV